MRRVAAIVGISEPTLYYYFKDRESLVIAAHIERLKINLATTIEPFLAAVHSCRDQAEFLHILLDVYHHSYQPGREIVRKQRAELIGASIQRERLRLALVDEVMVSLEGSIRAIDHAKEMGWLRADLDSKAFALFNLSIISSLIYAELQEDAALTEHWKSLAIEAVTAIVLSRD